MESMVQRVVRQALEANLTTDITLATNASQLDIIKNQLGDNVSVVTEPEGRDTFPAIALAASYLSLTKNCSDDEVVVIMHHILTKSITIKAGKNFSYHIHHHRSETLTFTHGEGAFVLNGAEQRVKAGDTVHIPVEQYHTIKAITELTFIEVQLGNPFIEKDIERFDRERK